MKTFKEFFTLGISKPSNLDVQNYLDRLGSARHILSIPDIIKKIEGYFKTIKNLKIDRSARKVLSFEEFNPEINEKVEYYLDTTRDNTEKYIATDGDYWYTGKIGVKGDNMFLKLAATRISRSYFEDGIKKGKIKKTTPEKLEKDAGMTVDFKKLYKK